MPGTMQGTAQADKLRRSFRFMLDNAGYATPPGRAACALKLAKAEVEAKSRGWWIGCEPDSFGDGTYCAWLMEPQLEWNKDDKIIGALGGIDVADTEAPDYWRVIFAELASEALAS